MSDTLAHYTFIPWFRQGLSVKIDEKDHYAAPDQTGSADERATLDVELYIEDTALADGNLNESVIRKKVSIYGPGDVKGISNRAIIRTEPKPGISNYETNNLVHIEFYEEDFPWRYTPVNPDDSTPLKSRRLRPWIALVVLERNDKEFTLSNKTEGLSFITVPQEVINKAFPAPSELWAWAHVQFNRKLQHTSGNSLITEVDNELEDDPDMGFSRIICPRKLQKDTPYTAFLIPAFETGRLGGLGEATSGIKAQKAAWNITENGDSDPDLRFPVYYHWDFHTGKFGDFETLVSILEPVITQSDNGKIPMDIQSPGFGLDGMAEKETLGFEGALKPPGFQSDPFLNEAGNQDFKEQLRKVLNLSVDLAEDQTTLGNNAAEIPHPFYSSALNAIDDPIIVPPTYGIWHALIRKLPQNPPSGKSWIHRLNLDPRYRAAAGLGTKTVQKEQENLMEEAWKQVGEINKANEMIRKAEMSKMVSTSIFKKHLKHIDNDRFLTVSNAMHNGVFALDNSQTLNQQFLESRIPVVAKSAAFRRITRPGKKVNKKMNARIKSHTPIHRQVLFNFNKDEGEPEAVTAAKLKSQPSNTLTFDNAATLITMAQANYTSDPKLLAKDAFLNFFNQKMGATLADRLSWKATINADVSLQANVKVELLTLIDDITAMTTSGGKLQITIKGSSYESFFGKGSSGKYYQNTLILKEGETEIDHIGSATTREEIQLYQNSFSLLQQVVNNQTQINFITPVRLQQIANLNNVGSDLKTKLHPSRTIPNRIIRQIKIWNGLEMKPIEELKPVMAHPEFKEPVYEELKKISQDFILPNVEKLPQDSITILQTNQRFIESYMAGLNHEMSRELLWREFPTDQRGTYFRQFWDIRDNLLESDPEKQFDIKKMHLWNKDLGNNRSRLWNENDPNNDGNIVLVVRGQLLLKYPNTMIYAQKAAYNPEDPSEQRILSADTTENIRFPMFSAELNPDIFLFGFDLTINQVRGERIMNSSANTSTANPGWFFVFKERPGQIRFGLDDYADELGDESGMPGSSFPETWNDLTWEHLVDKKDDLKNYCIRLDKNLNITNPEPGEIVPQWGSNSADMASILFQNPVIFARHSAEMLPGE